MACGVINTKTFSGRTLSIPPSMVRLSNSQTDVCRQNQTIVIPKDFRHAYSPSDGLAVRVPGSRKIQLVQCRLSYKEGDRKQDVIGGSLMQISPQPSYRSCIHHEVLLWSTSSVVFLDKSLFISLGKLDGRGPGQPTLYKSTLSVRLGVSSRRKSFTDSNPTKTKQCYRRPRAVFLGSNERSGKKSGLGRCRSPLSKQWGRKVEQTAPTHGVNSKADDSDTQHHNTTVGLLSFRGPSPSNTKACRQKGNADEAAFPTQSNFRHRQRTFNIGPVDSRALGKKTKEQQEHGVSTEPQKVSFFDEKACYYHSRLKPDSLKDTPKTLSLKEALELFRPDFISRSQGRVRRLEQRASRRRALQDSNPDLLQGLREDRGKHKRKCTTPDPLSDNLFKPRERSISGREMQLRSRRIYNKLPEVTKKKEEEKKRAVSQTNRLRAEVFKKKLLDQILQR